MRLAPPKILRLLAVPALFAAMTSGCAYRHEKGGAADDDARVATLSPSFAQVRDQVFVPKCITCHHHQNDFSDYAKTYAERGSIHQRVFVDRSMPKGDTLTGSQSALLKKWLDSGAPEQAELPPANPAPEPTVTPAPKPTATPGPGDPVAEALVVIRQNYEAKIHPLFKRSCTACHDSHARPEGILGELPGIRQREWTHIRNASKVMDLSLTFPAWSTQNSNPVFFLDQIRSALQKNTMPTWDFRFAHKLDGRLLKSYEKQAVIDWTVESERLLAAADTARPTALKIYQNRCLGCHNSGDNAGELVFGVAANQLVIPHGTASNGMAYFAPGSPETSAAFVVLLADPAARKGLPQMPKNGDSLSDQERDIVYDWFKQQQ